MKNTSGISVVLSNEKSLEFFYNSLCNVYGNGYWNGYGLEFDYNRGEYKKVKEELQNEGSKSVCFEDVIMKMLKMGFGFSVIDHEGGEDSDYNKTIRLKDIYDKVQLTPMTQLSNIIDENDDASDADCLLQTIFFGEVIFG